MKALQDIKLYCGIFGLTALLCSCSSAVFPDITEDEEDAVVSQDSEEHPRHPAQGAGEGCKAGVHPHQSCGQLRTEQGGEAGGAPPR